MVYLSLCDKMLKNRIGGSMMPQANAFRFRRGDFVAVAFVFLCALALSAGLWMHRGQSDAVMAQIYQDGKLIEEIPLTGNRTLTVTGSYTNVITVADGKIAVTSTDCPGEDCRHTGWIHVAGGSIVCLPNRVEIRLVGDGGVDAVVG